MASVVHRQYAATNAKIVSDKKRVDFREEAFESLTCFKNMEIRDSFTFDCWQEVFVNLFSENPASFGEQRCDEIENQFDFQMLFKS